MQIASLTLQELEQLLVDFPWFVSARREYIKRVAKGEDGVREAAKDSFLFVLSRRDFLKRTTEETLKYHSDLERKDREEREKRAAVDAGADSAGGDRKRVAEEPKPRYIVVGGDYFGKEDFDELTQSGLAYTDEFSFNPINMALGSLSQPISSSNGDSTAAEPRADSKDLEIYTETLAKIYVQQQFYSKAIAIYKKLILLNPEKSSYFATLIEKVKNKNI